MNRYTRTLAIVLAGGAGGRMGPLTEHRAKPALPFAGLYRLIDFPLSNCANSGIEDVWVVQQYQPHSLEGHLANGRPWDLDRTRGGLLILHPFSGGEEGGFHEGNADALWGHHELIAEFDADVVLVLSADAPYLFDYRRLIDAHLERDADVTMATVELGADSGEDASRFGVVEVDGEGRVTAFAYKPDDPPSDIVTMEVFAYRPSSLLDTLDRLAAKSDELKDFGEGLLPELVEGGRAFEHRFDGYWRDVGTPASYFSAHQDLLAGRVDLDDRAWPVRTTGAHRPPARIRPGASVENSLISPGCDIAGRVVDSVLSPGVVVEAGATVERSVLFSDVTVRSGATVQRAIVDSRATIEPGDQVRGESDEDPALVVPEEPRQA